MQTLITYVEELLESHDFVSIPYFGGFVANNVGATEDDGTFYPPHKLIGFNPSLNYNDGLLAQRYAQEQGITIEEANKLIIDDVNRLKYQINCWHHCGFGQIGMFHLADGKITFAPSEQGLALKSSFALTSIFFPVLETVANAVDTGIVSKQVTTETIAPVKAHNTVKFSRSRFYAVAAAAIALLLILFPTNVKDTRNTESLNQCAASFVPPTVVVEDTVEEAVADTLQEAAPSVSYNIVIGSFYSRSKAEQYIGELPQKYGANCTIIYSEHRYRVSYASFGTEEECDAFLESFTSANPRFADAWILEEQL